MREIAAAQAFVDRESFSCVKLCGFATIVGKRARVKPASTLR
jgi:hypothetical protein